MEKSIVLYLVLMLIGYVKDSDGAEESDVIMQNSWSLDTLSPGKENKNKKQSKMLYATTQLT